MHGCALQKGSLEDVWVMGWLLTPCGRGAVFRTCGSGAGAESLVAGGCPAEGQSLGYVGQGAGAEVLLYNSCYMFITFVIFL